MCPYICTHFGISRISGWMGSASLPWYTNIHHISVANGITASLRYTNIHHISVANGITASLQYTNIHHISVANGITASLQYTNIHHISVANGIRAANDTNVPQLTRLLYSFTKLIAAIPYLLSSAAKLTFSLQGLKHSTLIWTSNFQTFGLCRRQWAQLSHKVPLTSPA